MLGRVEPGPALARAYCTLAGLWGVFEDRAKTIEWGTKAIALAQRIEDKTALVRALGSVGVASC